MSQQATEKRTSVTWGSVEPNGSRQGYARVEHVDQRGRVVSRKSVLVSASRRGPGMSNAKGFASTYHDPDYDDIWKEAGKKAKEAGWDANDGWVGSYFLKQILGKNQLLDNLQITELTQEQLTLAAFEGLGRFFEGITYDKRSLGLPARLWKKLDLVLAERKGVDTAFGMSLKQQERARKRREKIEGSQKKRDEKRLIWYAAWVGDLLLAGLEHLADTRKEELEEMQRGLALNTDLPRIYQEAAFSLINEFLSNKPEDGEIYPFARKYINTIKEGTPRTVRHIWNRYTRPLAISMTRDFTTAFNSEGRISRGRGKER